MKKIDGDMKEYLVKGMCEELDKDTEETNISVRWHKGMRHETIKNVAQWKEYKSLGYEDKADFFFRILEDNYEWWRNYFDNSPEYARQQEEQKELQRHEEYKHNKLKQEMETIDNFIRGI